MVNEILICECNNVEHQLIFTWLESYNDKIVYMDVHLKPLVFWKRFKYAIKYLFGYRCNYGAFDEFIFKSDDVDKLERIVEYLKKKKNE